MRIAAILCALLLLVPAALAGQVAVRARFDEVVQPGDEALFFVSVRNIEDARLRDVQVSVIGLDLPDAFMVSRSQAIRSQGSMSAMLPVAVPEYAQPGEYDIRISVVGKDGLRRTFHRVLTVR